MLAELFAHHPSCDWFEGNPMDAFGVFIAGEEYGVDETPMSLGLYGGCYMIVFHPGSLWSVGMSTTLWATCRRKAATWEAMISLRRPVC